MLPQLPNFHFINNGPSVMQLVFLGPCYVHIFARIGRAVFNNFMYVYAAQRHYLSQFANSMQLGMVRDDLICTSIWSHLGDFISTVCWFMIAYISCPFARFCYVHPLPWHLRLLSLAFVYLALFPGRFLAWRCHTLCFIYFDVSLSVNLLSLVSGIRTLNSCHPQIVATLK